MKKLVFILLLIFIAACNDIENCETDPNLDFFILRFYDLTSKEAQKVAFQVTSNGFFEGDPVTYIYGEGFYFSDSTGILLPLNPEEQTTSFQFDSIGTNVSYSITLSYETNIFIFDPDCAPSFYYTALDSVNYTFDSLAIPVDFTTRQLITSTTISPNVEVYF